MSNSDRQQVPPSLPFASPLAKPVSIMDQELLQCFHASKLQMCSNKISPQTVFNYFDF